MKLNIRFLLALKLYRTGKLSTGLSAKVAGVPRMTFLFLLGQHGLSPFGEEPDELEQDLSHARQASRPHLRPGINAGARNSAP